jgi:hypothetical protein
MNFNDNLDRNLLAAQEKSGIDLHRLRSDLSKIKQEFYPQTRSLSDKEIQYLCLCLSRYSLGQIAYYFYKHKIPSTEELQKCEDLPRLTRNLKSEMSSTLHKYLKKLMNLPEEESKPSWKKIVDLLRNSERYRYSPSSTKLTTKLSVLIEIESSQSFDMNHIQQFNSLLKQHGIENIKISELIEDNQG